MAEQTHNLEEEVLQIVTDCFTSKQHEPTSQDRAGNTEPDDTEEEPEIRRVIHVDKYSLPNGDTLLRLPTGEGVLIPGTSSPDAVNPLDENAIESAAPMPEADSGTETPTIPLATTKQEQEEPAQAGGGEPEAPSTKRRGTSSLVLVSLLLLCILAGGTLAYLFVLPLAATATVTITPQTKTLQKEATFTIATTPTAGQVQGRPLEAINFTRSKTVPATGHAHEDATSAAGVLTFYNADQQSYTIPAGTSLTVSSVTVVTDTTVTVQAALPPSFGIGITHAHTIQAGSAGNIPANIIDTRCCGSQFVTATNTAPFSGGQDARTYSFIQSSDIQNAAHDLLAGLTPKTSAALQKETRPGEQLVPPLCSPQTQASAQPGAERVSVTVSVTQTCTSVAYRQDSLQQGATNTLAQSLNLANYQQEGAVQVSVNGSTYANHTATLKVFLSGVWVYHFTKAQLAALTRHIAGESQQEAKATLARVDGVAQVSIRLKRLDFRSSLPTDPQRISVQFFYIVS